MIEEKQTREDWINNLIKSHHVTNTRDLSTEQVQKWMSDYIRVFGSICTEESFRRLLRKGKKNYLIECGMLEEHDIKEPDEELLEANVRFKKDKQKYMDTNRIERASFRNYARVENAITAYGEALLEIMTKHGKELSKYNPQPIPQTIIGEKGVVHISDLHLLELIDLPHNKFDIRVASSRLHKLADEAIRLFKSRNITEIMIVNTGDVLGADCILDKLLNLATNRSKGTFIAVDLLKHFILHLSHNFKVNYVAVLGNESRVKKEMSFSDSALSDNYDMVISEMLKKLFKASNNPNVYFGEVNKVEMIVEINGHKTLLTHDVPRSSSSQKGTQSVIGMRYLLNSPFDVMLTGHIHDEKLTHTAYRSSSLAGSNSYNENALHLAGNASQNLYIFGNKYRYPMTIDLQNCDMEICYDIEESIIEYDCKTVADIRQQHTGPTMVI